MASSVPAFSSGACSVRAREHPAKKLSGIGAALARAECEAQMATLHEAHQQDAGG